MGSIRQYLKNSLWSLLALDCLSGADKLNFCLVESLYSGFILATMLASSFLVKLQFNCSKRLPTLSWVWRCFNKYFVYKLCERPLLSTRTKALMLCRVPYLEYEFATNYVRIKAIYVNLIIFTYPMQKFDSQYIVETCWRLDSLIKWSTFSGSWSRQES